MARLVVQLGLTHPVSSNDQETRVSSISVSLDNSHGNHGRSSIQAEPKILVLGVVRLLWPAHNTYRTAILLAQSIPYNAPIPRSYRAIQGLITPEPTTGRRLADTVRARRDSTPCLFDVVSICVDRFRRLSLASVTWAKRRWRRQAGNLLSPVIWR
jgi:hypothetical protein